jgi:nucleoside-diphosphate-sugar epimerase
MDNEPNKIKMNCAISRLCPVKTSNKSNIFLTGATGILGSHILFELLPLYAGKILKGKIVLLIRPDKRNNAEERLRNVLTSQSIPDMLKSIPLSDLLKHIVIVSSGLKEFTAGMLPEHISNYTVIHAASSVNLGHGEELNREIEDNNYLGTIHLLGEMALHTSRFVFVSTAYSSGHRLGEIGNDFLSTDEYSFRNPYELYKHKTEKYIERYCTLYGIEWKIIRPSIICGRLIDPPYYAISRFLVFYLFARYAMAIQNRLKETELRLQVPGKALINIVPVDFVAKALIASLNEPLSQLNVVNPENVSCRSLFRSGFELIKFSNYSFLEEMPETVSPVEKMLYSIVGSQLGPYMNTPEHHFNTSLLTGLMPDIKLPSVEDHFCELLEFAVDKKFVPLY